MEVLGKDLNHWKWVRQPLGTSDNVLAKPHLEVKHTETQNTDSCCLLTLFGVYFLYLKYPEQLLQGITV